MIQHRNLPRISAIVYLFALLIYLDSQAAGANGYVKGSEEFSDVELRAVYDSLPAADQAVIDGWTSEERTRYLQIHAATDRAKRNRNAYTIPTTSPGKIETPYTVDPSLKTAYLAYLDENRPAAEVIPLFEEYIKENPESPFLAEVYFRIGALYSIHRRKNEGPNWQMEKYYYEKAHEIYGTQFSYLNDCAWASLVNSPQSTLSARKEYYAWLLRLNESADVNDAYPIRELSQTFNGRPPELSAKEKQDVVVAGIKQNVPKLLDTAEKNIFYRTANNYSGLVDLAASYPNTALGEQARLRIEKMDRLFLQELDSSMPSDEDASMETAVRTQQDTSGNQQAIYSIHEPNERQLASASSGWWRKWIAFGLVSLSMIAGIAIWALRSHGNQLSRGNHNG